MQIWLQIVTLYQLLLFHVSITYQIKNNILFDKSLFFYKIMDNEINNNKMIYYTIHEIRYRLSKPHDEKIIFG